jgi:hypothetical protein
MSQKYVWYKSTVSTPLYESALLLDCDFVDVFYNNRKYHACKILKVYHSISDEDDAGWMHCTIHSDIWENGVKFDTFEELKKYVWLTQGLVINE